MIKDELRNIAEFLSGLANDLEIDASTIQEFDRPYIKRKAAKVRSKAANIMDIVKRLDNETIKLNN